MFLANLKNLRFFLLKNAIKFNYEGGQVKNINEKNRENRVFDKFSEGADWMSNFVEIFQIISIET